MQTDFFSFGTCEPLQLANMHPDQVGVLHQCWSEVASHHRHWRLVPVTLASKHTERWCIWVNSQTRSVLSLRYRPHREHQGSPQERGGSRWRVWVRCCSRLKVSCCPESLYQQQCVSLFTRGAARHEQCGGFQERVCSRESRSGN